MATKTISFAGADKNPYLPADNPAGGDYTSRRADARVSSNSWNSATDSVWSCDVDPVADTFSVQTVFGLISSNAAGIEIHDASGNGWLFIANNSNCRVFAMSAWALSGGALFTYTSAFGNGAALNVDVTQSTGTFAVKNGTTTIGTFVNTTYTSGLKSGLTSRGGLITSFTLTYTPSRTVNTITNPVVLGSAISVGLTGYTAPTSVTGGGMSAAGLSYGAGTLTATWPALSESLAPTIALPATNVTVTVTESGGSSTIATDFDLPADHVATSFLSAIDDPRYIGGNIALTDDWRAYYDNDQPEVGEIEIQADGRIIADNPGTFVMWLHKLGTGLPLVQYNFTINEAGDIVTATIDSVGTVRIGGTTAVTVSDFTTPVNAGTLDGVALTSASDTSITVAALVDGENIPRPGTRELELTDGIDTAADDVPVLAPSGWSSYVITGDFVEAVNGVGADYLPVGWEVTDFILSPLAPSTGKTTEVTDAGVITNNVGTQELFLVDAATGLATAFDIVTTAGAGEIGTGSSAEPAMQVIKMETLKMVGL